MSSVIIITNVFFSPTKTDKNCYVFYVFSVFFLILLSFIVLYNAFTAKPTYSGLVFIRLLKIYCTAFSPGGDLNFGVVQRSMTKCSQTVNGSSSFSFFNKNVRDTPPLNGANRGSNLKYYFFFPFNATTEQWERTKNNLRNGGTRFWITSSVREGSQMRLLYDGTFFFF